jgi:hypothetical protein
VPDVSLLIELRFLLEEAEGALRDYMQANDPIYGPLDSMRETLSYVGWGIDLEIEDVERGDPPPLRSV